MSNYVALSAYTIKARKTQVANLLSLFPRFVEIQKEVGELSLILFPQLLQQFSLRVFCQHTTGREYLSASPDCVQLFV